MKSFQLFTVLALISLVGLNACSGGGSSLVYGDHDRCKENFSLFPDKPTNGQTELKLDPAAKEIPPGVYAYNGADLYYVDSKTNLRVLVHDSLDEKNGTSSSSIGCYRNAKPGMTGMVVEAEGISAMTVDQNFKTTIETREFNFVIAGGTMERDFRKGQDKLEKSPLEIYDPAHPAQFVKTSVNANTDFELRSSGVSSTGTYELVIRLKRTDSATP
jgi:hypothetical protein